MLKFLPRDLDLDSMGHRQPTTYYMDVLVDLPPHLARSAFRAQIEPRADRQPDWGGARLTPAKSPITVGDGPLSPLLSQRAVLTAGWHRWPVDLELLAWSESRCQLGLSPRLRYRSPGLGNPVFPAGHALLRAFAEAMTSWAAEPPRRSASDAPKVYRDSRSKAAVSRWDSEEPVRIGGSR